MKVHSYISAHGITENVPDADFHDNIHVKGPFSHKHPNKGPLRNHQKTFSVIFDQKSISSHETLYITFLEPEKQVFRGYKFTWQRKVQNNIKLK